MRVLRIRSGAGLLAQGITSKYANPQPWYRLEDIFRCHDVSIPRSTMCDWMAKNADILYFLIDLIKKQVLASRVIHTDDTSVKFLPVLGIITCKDYLGFRHL